HLETVEVFAFAVEPRRGDGDLRIAVQCSHERGDLRFGPALPVRGFDEVEDVVPRAPFVGLGGRERRFEFGALRTRLRSAVLPCEEEREPGESRGGYGSARTRP